MSRDDGSTLPLILGFFLVALLTAAGAVAAGDAFVQQRDLQHVCDGAAAAAAASGADLSRAGGVGGGSQLRFAGVQQAVAGYLARDGSRAGVQAVATLSADQTRFTVTCTRTAPIAFGAMFGKASGVRHVARASARAPLS